MRQKKEVKVSGNDRFYCITFLTIVSFIFLFAATITSPSGVSADVIINEVDSDSAGTDTLEFIELYDGGTGNTDLSGMVVVFYNGSNDSSYAAYDLGSFTTNASGYFVLGNAAVANVDLVFPDNTLQNGADAVALYTGDAADFPNDTPVTTTGLIDAIVYGTDDPDDPGLAVLLNPGQPQVNENAGGDKDNHSNQRIPNGSGGALNTDTYTQGQPTPGTANGEIMPAPDIKVNGSDGQIVITPDDTVDVIVSLDPGDKTDAICDWWVGALTPFGTFWVTPSLTWQKSDSALSAGQYPLFYLSETGLLTTNLPQGIYTLFFVIDDNPDGKFEVTWYDYVNVISSTASVK